MCESYVLDNLHIIVCIDTAHAIGKNNKLLYNIEDNIKHFLDITKGHVVIMGRNTLNILPNKKPLIDCENIILTSQHKCIENAILVHDIDDLLDIVNNKNDICYVIGGGYLYEELLSYCSTLNITFIVNGCAHDADTWFPIISKKDWYVFNQSEEFISEQGFIYKFITYKRL